MSSTFGKALFNQNSNRGHLLECSYKTPQWFNENPYECSSEAPIYEQFYHSTTDSVLSLNPSERNSICNIPCVEEISDQNYIQRYLNDQYLDKLSSASTSSAETAKNKTSENAYEPDGTYADSGIYSATYKVPVDRPQQIFNEIELIQNHFTSRLTSCITLPYLANISVLNSDSLPQNDFLGIRISDNDCPTLWSSKRSGYFVLLGHKDPQMPSHMKSLTGILCHQKTLRILWEGEVAIPNLVRHQEKSSSSIASRSQSFEKAGFIHENVTVKDKIYRVISRDSNNLVDDFSLVIIMANSKIQDEDVYTSVSTFMEKHLVRIDVTEAEIIEIDRVNEFKRNFDKFIGDICYQKRMSLKQKNKIIKSERVKAKTLNLGCISSPCMFRQIRHLSREDLDHVDDPIAFVPSKYKPSMARLQTSTIKNYPS